jgi:hypothetical protein
MNSSHLATDYERRSSHIQTLKGNIKEVASELSAVKNMTERLRQQQMMMT